MRFRGIAGVAAGFVLLLAAGCSTDEGEASEVPDVRESGALATEEATESGPEGPDEVEPGPEVEVEASAVEDPEEPPISSDIDITTVPDEITIEYVQAVIDELERIYTEAMVLLMREEELTLGVTDRLGEIFTLEQSELRLRELLEALDSQFEGFLPREEVVSSEWKIDGVVEASSDCLWLRGTTSASGFLASPPPPSDSFFLLRESTVTRPVNINQTPWVLAALRIGDPDELELAGPCHG